MSQTRRPRLPLRPRSALDESQRALHDRIVDGPRRSQAAQVPIVDESGALLGPFGIMTIAPAVGEAVQAMGAALRFSSGLDPLVREAAILLAASHHRCEFEWFAHERPARQAGLDDHQVAALKQGSVPEGLDADATEALGIVCALLAAGDLDDAAYAAAIGSLGAATLAELVWLCGYYSMLALALAVFDPPNPITADRAF